MDTNTERTASDEVWETLRTQCEDLEPGAELRTPISERRFRVVGTAQDRITVRFLDSDEERSLWREQFDVLLDGLDDGSVRVDALQPGVEPYASVLTLSGEFTTDGETIERAPTETADGESPYLIPATEARSQPERVHDDALLLADFLERHDAADPVALDTETLTDLYVLGSDVQRGSDRLRRSAREPLLERLGPDQRLHGRFGTVRRTTRERRYVKDDETVFDALDEHGIPREWVLGIDRDKLDVVLSATDLTEAAVYDVDESVYIQKTGVDEDEKVSRLQGIADRIDELDGVEGEELQAELAEIEDRLEEALSVG